MLQLEFFELEDIEKLRAEVEKLKASNEKMRKALFARHGQLNKHYLDIIERLLVIEKNICSGVIDHIADLNKMSVK